MNMFSNNVTVHVCLRTSDFMHIYNRVFMTGVNMRMQRPACFLLVVIKINTICRGHAHLLLLFIFILSMGFLRPKVNVLK